MDEYVIFSSSSVQEVAGPRAVVVLQTEHVPQPAVQISEGRHRAAAGQSLREAAAARQRRTERQLRLRSALPRVRGDEGQTRPEDAAAGGRGKKAATSQHHLRRSFSFSPYAPMNSSIHWNSLHLVIFLGNPGRSGLP